MSECAHDPRFDGDDVVCLKCGERRDAITGATIPSAPAVTDQQSAEVEALKRLADECDSLRGQVECHRSAWETANADRDALAQRIETLTRERDSKTKQISELVRTARSEQVRANQAEAQRDRLAEALREFADPENWSIEPAGTAYDSFEWDGGSEPIKFARAALSEIEQAASNDGEKEAVT